MPLLHRDVGTLIVLNDTVARLIVNRSPHFSFERRITLPDGGRLCLLIMHVEGVVGEIGPEVLVAADPCWRPRWTPCWRRGRGQLAERLIIICLRRRISYDAHYMWGCYRTASYMRTSYWDICLCCRLLGNYTRRHLDVTVGRSSSPSRIYSLSPRVNIHKKEEIERHL